jgi:hypothetical protein
VRRRIRNPVFARMSEPEEISRVITGVFRGWRAAGVDFLVLRNYETLPHFTTNDIDVLVAPAQLAQAETVLLTAAGQSGFRLHNRAEFATLALYLSSRDSNAQVHFDLFTDLKWRSLDFLDCQDFLREKVIRGDFAVPHPAHEAATNLLAFLIYTGQVKEKYRASITAGFKAAPAVAMSLLAATYGQELAKQLVEEGTKGDWKAIETRIGALRRALATRQMTRHLARTLFSISADALRLIRRWLRPPGLTIALCGADGSGKSTAARGIIEGLGGTFSPRKGRSIHWKPPVFSGGRRSARGPTSDPHGQPPRNAAASLIYFGFHWLEFFLGSILCLRPVTFRGGLVLIDRYYYDFFVDPRRYRLRLPTWVVRLGYVFVAKPDLVILLDAPAAVLHARKQEVPPAETERQCGAYKDLIGSLPNGRIVDATQSPEKVAADINHAVLEYLAARQAKVRRE